MSKKIVLILLTVITLFVSCKKDKQNSQSTDTANLAAKVNTGTISEIEETSARCSFEVTEVGTGQLTAGLCWSKNPTPKLTDSQIAIASTTGNHTGLLTGLSPKTTYYVRAYATNDAGTVYGEEKTATTKEPLPPYLGRYNSGSGAYFEFFLDGTVHFGASGYISGTYSMVSLTQVQINIASIGTATFSPDFKSLTSSVGTYYKN